MGWLKYSRAISGAAFALFGLLFLMVWLAMAADSSQAKFEWESLLVLVLPIGFMELGLQQFTAGLQAADLPFAPPSSDNPAAQAVGCFAVLQLLGQFASSVIFILVSCAGVAIALFWIGRNLMDRPLSLTTPFLIQSGLVAAYLLLRWPVLWLVAKIRA